MTSEGLHKAGDEPAEAAPGTGGTPPPDGAESFNPYRSGGHVPPQQPAAGAAPAPGTPQRGIASAGVPRWPSAPNPRAESAVDNGGDEWPSQTSWSPSVTPESPAPPNWGPSPETSAPAQSRWAPAAPDPSAEQPRAFGGGSTPGFGGRASVSGAAAVPPPPVPAPATPPATPPATFGAEPAPYNPYGQPETNDEGESYAEATQHWKGSAYPGAQPPPRQQPPAASSWAAAEPQQPSWPAEQPPAQPPAQPAPSAWGAEQPAPPAPSAWGAEQPAPPAPSGWGAEQPAQPAYERSGLPPEAWAPASPSTPGTDAPVSGSGAAPSSFAPESPASASGRHGLPQRAPGQFEPPSESTYSGFDLSSRRGAPAGPATPAATPTGPATPGAPGGFTGSATPSAPGGFAGSAAPGVPAGPGDTPGGRAQVPPAAEQPAGQSAEASGGLSGFGAGAFTRGAAAAHQGAETAPEEQQPEPWNPPVRVPGASFGSTPPPDNPESSRTSMPASFGGSFNGFGAGTPSASGGFGPAAGEGFGAAPADDGFGPAPAGEGFGSAPAGRGTFGDADSGYRENGPGGFGGSAPTSPASPSDQGGFGGFGPGQPSAGPGFGPASPAASATFGQAQPGTYGTSAPEENPASEAGRFSVQPGGGFGAEPGYPAPYASEQSHDSAQVPQPRTPSDLPPASSPYGQPAGGSAGVARAAVVPPSASGAAPSVSAPPTGDPSADGPATGRAVAGSASVPTASKITPPADAPLPPPASKGQARVYGKAATPAPDESSPVSGVPVSGTPVSGSPVSGGSPAWGGFDAPAASGPHAVPGAFAVPHQEQGPVNGFAHGQQRNEPPVDPQQPPHFAVGGGLPYPGQVVDGRSVDPRGTMGGGRGFDDDGDGFPGTPSAGFAAAPPRNDGYGAPPQHDGFGPPQQDGFGPSQHDGFGVPPQQDDSPFGSGPGVGGPPSFGGNTAVFSSAPGGFDNGPRGFDDPGAGGPSEQDAFDKFKATEPEPAKDPLPPPKKGGNGGVLIAVVVVAALLVAIPLLLVWLISSSKDTAASFDVPVGGCVRNSGNAPVVAECAEPDAFTVVSRAPSKDQCADASQPFIEIQAGGDVLCLAPAVPATGQNTTTG